jgi:hypothetical protein
MGDGLLVSKEVKIELSVEYVKDAPTAAAPAPKK